MAAYSLPQAGLRRLCSVSREGIEARLAEVQARVTRAAEGAGRDPGSIEVLPVTKGHPPAAVEAVASAGLACIGENRVPEARDKQHRLGGRAGLTWHMIGRLQRNKARKALDLFDVIESVDSLKLAATLSRIVEEEGREPVEILVEVNASGEGGKAGLTLDGAIPGIDEICRLPGVRVSGLMTMAPHTDDEQVVRKTFRRVRELAGRCAEEVPAFEGGVLSMGMSNDFEIAIEEGSTRVRLGTVLLGER